MQDIPPPAKEPFNPYAPPRSEMKETTQRNWVTGCLWVIAILFGVLFLSILLALLSPILTNSGK